ncbi:MAG TPA: L-fucose:H+ symporter permease [Chitinophagaceae bacterium]|nr:L-fucose:H+ symporter permease [Chitinophagaceae bacterium]
MAAYADWQNCVGWSWALPNHYLINQPTITLMALPPLATNATAANAAPAAQQRLLFPFIMVTSLFFFWGFIHNLDPVLIPHLKRAFSLNALKASLVDSAVYLGYFLMAIPAGMIMKKYGYKTGILLGLGLFAIGCFLFIPAADTMQYVFFLGALFIVACGLAILETAANPYATILGDPATSTQRLNFAQSFNGLAAFLAPIIGGRLILAEQPLDATALNAMTESARALYLQQETSTVKLPYIILGSAILVMAALFFFTKLPDIKEKDATEKAGFLHVLRHKHLAWAVVAQFFYVGAQVCILSFLILFATKAAGITEKEASNYSGAAGLAFMVGRFAGTFFMRYLPPPRLLAYYSIACILLCLVTILGSGMITLYANIGIAFFMSIMFPTIFALGIKDIGADTKPASSLIIMAIVGGAVLPPMLAYIGDATGNFQYGYVVPLICFAVILYFGLKGHRISGPAEPVRL